MRVEITDGCWLWRATRVWSGYGRFWQPDGSRVYAHRWAYEQMVGPIPEGLQLDHTCHNADLSCPGGVTCPHRACVNPRHLEPVTALVNIMRGRTIAAAHSAQTHCKRGHEFTPENTYLWRGGRSCRTCVLERSRQRRRAA